MHMVLKPDISTSSAGKKCDLSRNRANFHPKTNLFDGILPAEQEGYLYLCPLERRLACTRSLIVFSYI